jgi:hypothetical protein
MDIQIATLCDSAAEYGGKLCIMGTFDQIFARQFPVVHPHCCLVLRLCFRAGDEGNHKLGIAIIDADGKPIMPPIEGELGVQLPPDAYFITRNLPLNIQGIQFKEAGQYAIEVSIDGKSVASIPLAVMQVPGGPQQEAA